ncbi:hypothetical protein, partial [Methanococcoides seepicolus]
MQIRTILIVAMLCLAMSGIAVAQPADECCWAEASAASASELYNLTYPKDTLSCGDVDVGVIVDGNNVTVEVIFLSPTYLSNTTSIKTFGLNTVGLTEANVTGITGANRTLTGVDSFSAEFGNLNTTVGFVTSEKTLGPITITFDGPVVLVPNSLNFNAAVHLIGLNEGLSVKVADGECPIPVAAEDIKCCWEKPCGTPVEQCDQETTFVLYESNATIVKTIHGYVYVDMEPDVNGVGQDIITAGDIRLSEWHTNYEPNTKVMPEDLDNLDVVETV